MTAEVTVQVGCVQLMIKRMQNLLLFIFSKALAPAAMSGGVLVWMLPLFRKRHRFGFPFIDG